MQKHLELSLSVILQTAVMIQGQSISPLTTPYPVQATNSTVVITATASPPSSVISSGGNWIVDWRYNGTRVAQAGYVPYPDVDSAADSSIYSSRINISAVAMSASNFTTQLTIAQLRADEDGYQVELGGIGIGFDSQPIVLDIRDCNSSLPYDVIVDTTSRIFNSPGKFACSNGGNLFYSNGIILTSSDTTCLASAEWSDQDNLQCWTAPNVTLASSSIEGNKLIVIEGANLSLTCNYNDVIPEGSTSRLYIGGNNYNRTQGEPFILSSLQRSDSNKVVSCQAVTPYTDAYPASGRSLEYTLDVLYEPDTVVSKVELSQYTIVAENGYLLRSDENLTMQCINGEANPPANCNFTFHMTQSNTVSSVSGCSISYDLDQSSLVSCTAGNEVGSRSSNNETITVVPAQRNLEFNVTGSNITNTGERVASYPGENLTFICNIAFSDQLNTTYELKVSDKKLFVQSFDLKPIKPSNTGNYSCTTMDSFGSYSSSIYLDVLYLSLSVVNTIQISQYVIESSESNYLLRSDQQLTMNCTPSDANPPATCSWQLCSDSRCQILTSDGVCLISVDLNASSNVTCNAENVVGIISSAEQTVDVIPAERQVQFNVTGNNVANDGSINSTTYLGEHIIISCSVSYENELSTAYLIKLPDNTMVSQSSKLFSSVTRFDTGDYICNTNDQFGSFNAAIYLNVIYAATQDDKIPACNWNLNETEICSVVFFSNPNSLFISLSKNGSSVASDGSMTIESTGDQQTFTFTRTQVTNSDNGSYELTVKSSSGSLFSNSVLYFHIEVVDNTNDNGEPLGTPGLSTGAIAGIIAGVVVVILCAAGYGVYKWRNGSQEKNGSRSNEMYPTGSGNRTLTDQPGYIDVTANDSTQINSDNQRNYEVVGPAEDENGYLAVHGSTTDHLRNRASNSQLETDNAGYIVLNGEESNAQSNNQENASSSSKRYENIEGAYDDVITTPRVHTENVSRRYENVEGPYDEINKS
ncbi:uncharacterized protein LOC143446905 isoform X1 [Clavelina lepadiformis]|uniref:uncharacterized protein LOC143446905 isoform X1 n=1 Tax=Clavelina lepadiformis TaxID=159417 RepID=UPI0040438E8D